jgi:hypothetical protein
LNKVVAIRTKIEQKGFIERSRSQAMTEMFQDVFSLVSISAFLVGAAFWIGAI